MFDRIPFDPWDTVVEALENRRTPLVVVSFVHDWSPPAYHTAVSLDKLRQSGECRFAEIFIVDASREPDRGWERGVSVTPATFFFWEGKPLTVRRPDYDDDNKFVGSVSAETMLSIIRFAREVGEEGNHVLFADIDEDNI